MTLNTYIRNTPIESAKHNADHQSLANGTSDTIANSLTTFRSESFFNYVASGCLWTADSVGVNKNASMSSGTVYIAGTRVPVNAVSARVFTASKDTYIDVDNTGALTYTEVANNAASPSLAVNNLRLGIITTDGTKIAATGNINQGQIGASSPTISSAILAVSDTLGNLIHNINPVPTIIGYSQATSVQSGITTITDLTSLVTNIIVPSGNRKIRITGSGLFLSTVANDSAVLYIREGSNTIALDEAIVSNSPSHGMKAIYIGTPSAGLHTYKLSLARDTGTGTIQLNCGTGYAAFISVELL